MPPNPTTNAPESQIITPAEMPAIRMGRTSRASARPKLARVSALPAFCAGDTLVAALKLSLAATAGRGAAGRLMLLPFIAPRLRELRFRTRV
jgi:hypothetical protein